MKKINALFLLVLCLSAAGACYKSGSTDKSKPAQNLATATPVVTEKTVENNQSDKTTTGGNELEKAVAGLEETVKKDPKNHQAFFSSAKIIRR